MTGGRRAQMLVAAGALGVILAGSINWPHLETSSRLFLIIASGGLLACHAALLRRPRVVVQVAALPLAVLVPVGFRLIVLVIYICLGVANIMMLVDHRGRLE